MAQLTDIIQQQATALEQMSESLSGINSVMDGQLESLKSIARWQDQTALYTSHLQNIKVDLNNIRKWGENIGHIADRIDVLASQEDAERQEDLSGGDDDAVSLSGALLQQIADNTERTAIAVEQMASVQAEPFEDKRTRTDAKPISRREQKSKGEQGELGKAVGTAGTFLGEIFKGFLALGAVVGSVLLAPSSFFETVKEFFGSLKGLFTQMMTFFVNDVAPVMSFLFEELLGFFNRLAPELSELGGAIGDALRQIGPELWNTVSPVLSFLADGIIKAVDMLTDGMLKLPDAVDSFIRFVDTIMEILFDPEGQYETHLEAVGAFFEGIGNFFNGLMEGDFQANFMTALNGFWNLMIDLINEAAFFLVDTYNMVASLMGKEQLKYEDFFIDKKVTVENADLTQQLSDIVASTMVKNPTMTFDEAVVMATEQRTIGDLLRGDQAGNVDYRVAGLDYMKGRFNEKTGRHDLSGESPGALATRERMTLLGQDKILQLAQQKFISLASNLELTNDAPGAVGTFQGGAKYKKITGIHDAMPRYSENYAIPDTIIVTDDKSGALYDHYYKEDGTKVDLEDNFIANHLTQLIDGMDPQTQTPTSTTPTTSTIVLPKNTFGTGTGAGVSRSSVDNRFVLDPSVHGSQPVVIAPTIAGGSTATTINSSQVSLSSGSTDRNPFYSK